LNKKNTAGRHAIGARKQSRKHSQHCNETPKEHDGVPILKKKISTDQQLILIGTDVPTPSAKKGQARPTPDHGPHSVPDNRTRCQLLIGRIIDRFTQTECKTVFAQSVGQSAPSKIAIRVREMPKLHSPRRALPSHCAAFDGVAF